MAKTLGITIKMGASDWGVTVPLVNGGTHTFDLAKMTKDQRRQFHAEFMAGYREAVNPSEPQRRRRRNRDASVPVT